MAGIPLSPSAQRARHVAKSTGKVMREAGHQKALFQWAEISRNIHPELRWLHSVPNGAHVTPVQAKVLLAEGLRAGVPDIFLDVPRAHFHGLRIELKAPEQRDAKGTIAKRKGAASDLQKEWLTHYRNNGYAAFVAYGWEDAQDKILMYLKA